MDNHSERPLLNPNQFVHVVKHKTKEQENQMELLDEYMPQLDAYNKIIRERRRSRNNVHFDDTPPVIQTPLRLAQEKLQERLNKQKEDEKAKYFTTMDSYDTLRMEIDEKQAIKAKIDKVHESLEERLKWLNAESQRAVQYLQKIQVLEEKLQTPMIMSNAHLPRFPLN